MKRSFSPIPMICMNRAIWIISILLLFSVSVLADGPENLLLNSYFEDGIENWELFLSNGAQMEAIIDDSDSVKGSQCVYLDIIQLGSSVRFWEVKLGQVILGVIDQGQTYTLSVWAKSEEAAGQIRPHLRIGPGGTSLLIPPMPRRLTLPLNGRNTAIRSQQAGNQTGLWILLWERRWAISGWTT